MTSKRAQKRHGEGQEPLAGFTVIELLVVISIIALLAGLVVGGSALAKRAGSESRLRAEMHQLITAIESYKEALGQYPPDNVKAPWASSLFYELSGVVVATTPGAEFLTKDGRQISAENVTKYFGVAGIANAATEMREVRSFIKPAASQHRTINRNDDKAVAGTGAAADVEVLVAPVRWPTGPAASVFPAPFSENPTANPWRYLATPNATNNSGSFDLWVEFVDGKQKKMICNWSEDVLVLSP